VTIFVIYSRHHVHFDLEVIAGVRAHDCAHFSVHSPFTDVRSLFPATMGMICFLAAVYPQVLVRVWADGSLGAGFSTSHGAETGSSCLYETDL